jgi:hypothetical protein
LPTPNVDKIAVANELAEINAAKLEYFKLTHSIATWKKLTERVAAIYGLKNKKDAEGNIIWQDVTGVDLMLANDAEIRIHMGTLGRSIGPPYIAEDGVEVALTSLKTTVVGNVTTVTISYSLKNITGSLKDEESWKLYYANGGGLPQYGFFGQMLPDQTLNRSYTFNVQAPDVPSVVDYPSRFFDKTWQRSDLIWEID